MTDSSNSDEFPSIPSIPTNLSIPYSAATTNSPAGAGPRASSGTAKRSCDAGATPSTGASSSSCGAASTSSPAANSVPSGSSLNCPRGPPDSPFSDCKLTGPYGPRFYGYAYIFLGVLPILAMMILSALRPDHWVLIFETAVVTVFALFWVFQTVELWTEMAPPFVPADAGIVRA